jgi:flagellar motor switch protein FliM
MVPKHMVTAHPLPAPVKGQTQEVAGQRQAAASHETANEEALVPVAACNEPEESLPLTPAVARLPVELDVTIPIRDFRVRTLLTLEPGQLIESKWANGDDVPLAAGDVQLAWSEFEVLDSQLAVRLTRLI